MQYLNQQDDIRVIENGQKVPAPKDSAVTLYWDPQRLDAGKTRDVGFTYGLGNVSSGEGGGHLLLTVGGRLVRDAEFTLTALVANPKPGETLALTLPAGLKLVSGGETQTVQPGAARDSSTVTWKLRAVRDGEYNLQVKSSNGQTQSQSVTIRSTGVFTILKVVSRKETVRWWWNGWHTALTAYRHRDGRRACWKAAWRGYLGKRRGLLSQAWKGLARPCCWII